MRYPDGFGSCVAFSSCDLSINADKSTALDKSSFSLMLSPLTTYRVVIGLPRQNEIAGLIVIFYSVFHVQNVSSGN